MKRFDFKKNIEFLKSLEPKFPDIKKIRRFLEGIILNSIFIKSYVFYPNIKILKDKKNSNSLDSYLGLINSFNWHSSLGSAGYGPVIKLLDDCIIKYNNKKIFNLIKRRISYLSLLKEEINYILNRYDWKNCKGSYEIFISKFEDFITKSCELLLIIINQYELLKEKKKKLNFNNFFSIINDIQSLDISKWFESLNHIIYLSSLIYIRNSIVHKPSKIRYIKNNQKPIIKTKNIIKDNKTSNNKLIELVKDFFNLYYKGPKTPLKKLKFNDKRFPGFSYNCELSKLGKFNEYNCEVFLNIEIIKYIEKISGILFISERDILNKMLK